MIQTDMIQTDMIQTDASLTETVFMDEAGQAQADIRRVTGDLVNMRAGPGQDFQPVDQVSGGTRVEVLETAPNGWVRLRRLDSGDEGWMAGRLVTASN